MKTMLGTALILFSMAVFAADDLCRTCPSCSGCGCQSCPLNLNTNVFQWKNRGVNPYTGDPEYRNIAPSYAFNSAEMGNSAYARY